MDPNARRRTVLVPAPPGRVRGAVLGVLAAVLAALAAPVAAQEPEPETVRVVHLVIDGLHPAQVGPLTPVLAELKASGVWYEQARAVMASETLPNHVSMATGAYPQVTGIPGNEGRAAVGDTAPTEPDLGQPELLEADSLTRTIERVCPDLRTVTVFSKEYVHRIFAADGADADFPQELFNVPESGHALDTTTVGFILAELARAAPDYLFANLGDVDRSGHIDATGAAGLPVEQLAALQQTDKLVGSIVAELRARGLWESTVLIVNSDHSMDWSVPIDPSSAVDVAGALEADPATSGRFFVSENGGAGLVYLLDPAAPDADEVLLAARDRLVDLPGVDEALYRDPNPLDPGGDLDAVHPDWHLRTPRAGELFVTVLPGHRVGSVSSNPYPGNHGHALTRHATMLVAGGWDGLAGPTVVEADPALVDAETFDDTAGLPGQAESVDLAPTIGWLLGVPDPRAPIRGTGRPQWQGRVLTEAFERQPAPRCVAAAPGRPGPPAAPGRPAPAAAPAPIHPRLPATGGGLALAGIALVAVTFLPRAPRSGRQ
ncbi:MAG: alkaline phosphatase family protein [Actinobacteria bacterium]|nr:alkaline phosphatase family protein [Actinomycetota bacterium]